jgi:hypothetical protein
MGQTCSPGKSVASSTVTGRYRRLAGVAWTRRDSLLPELTHSRALRRALEGAEGPSAVIEAEIEAAGLFGGYARALGWRRGKPGGTESDPTFRLRVAE